MARGLVKNGAVKHVFAVLFDGFFYPCSASHITFVPLMGGCLTDIIHAALAVCDLIDDVFHDVSLQVGAGGVNLQVKPCQLMAFIP